MRLFFHQRLDCDLANFILAHKPLHSLYVSPLKTVDHCTEMPGNKFGTPLSIWRFLRRTPGGMLSVPNTPDRPGAAGPRCGVSPASASFPWRPGPVESAGDSFLRATKRKLRGLYATRR